MCAMRYIAGRTHDAAQPRGAAMDHAQTLRDILSDLDSAAADIVAAARKYVIAVNADPLFAGYARDAAPWVRIETWGALTAIGNGTADWRVAMGVAPHAKLLSKLDAKTQSHLLDHGVDMPASGGDSYRMHLANMSGTQARAALAGGTLRTVAEITAAARRKCSKPVSSSRRWRVMNGVLRVYEPGDITREELVQILTAMSK